MPKTADLLTTAQVAAVKGVTVRTVVRWVKADRLIPAFRLPGDTGAYLFDPAVVAALVLPTSEPTEAAS